MKLKAFPPMIQGDFFCSTIFEVIFGLKLPGIAFGGADTAKGNTGPFWVASGM
jgi:hypothetical protein